MKLMIGPDVLGLTVAEIGKLLVHAIKVHANRIVKNLKFMVYLPNKAEKI
jgi:hypothetical protein